MIRKSLRHVLGVTALGTLVLVAGCSILPKSEPQTRYNLPATAMQSTAVQKNVSLYVAAPQANRLINSNRVLVQPTGSEIQIYKGTQWADNAPVLLRERFVQAFTDARLFNAVSSDAALKTDFARLPVLNNVKQSKTVYPRTPHIDATTSLEKEIPWISTAYMPTQIMMRNP